MRTTIFAAILTGVTCFSVPIPLSAQDYPIDCAIALCLPGGFPASTACTRAKAEVIRRITPFPIEPPLQLWRCPMNTGASFPGLDDEGLTPEMRQYRAGIEVWELNKRTSGGSGGREAHVTAIRNYYDHTGEFVRAGVDPDTIPSWVEAAVIRHAGLPLFSEYGHLRAILFKFDDWQGISSTEWISY